MLCCVSVIGFVIRTIMSQWIDLLRMNVMPLKRTYKVHNFRNKKKILRVCSKKLSSGNSKCSQFPLVCSKKQSQKDSHHHASALSIDIQASVCVCVCVRVCVCMCIHSTTYWMFTTEIKTCMTPLMPTPLP